jgi:hypothetical protein
MVVVFVRDQTPMHTGVVVSKGLLEHGEPHPSIQYQLVAIGIEYVAIRFAARGDDMQLHG